MLWLPRRCHDSIACFEDLRTIAVLLTCSSLGTSAVKALLGDLQGPILLETRAWKQIMWGITTCRPEEKPETHLSDILLAYAPAGSGNHPHACRRRRRDLLLLRAHCCDDCGFAEIDEGV